MPQKTNHGLTAEQEIYLAFAHDRIKKAKETGSRLNDVYIREYEMFVIWVIKSDRMPDKDNFPFRFICRNTVDGYWVNVVSKREVATKNSLSRIRQAIQKMWTEVKSRPLSPNEVCLLEGESKAFAIASDSVKIAEAEQQRFYKSIKGIKFQGTDPFKGLKADLLTTKEKKIIIDHVMKYRSDWKDVGCSFNWGCNGGVRGDSTRSLRIQDLYISLGFAPDQGENLTIILRKDDQKVHFTSDRLVGVLRHREYLLCAAFMTSMNLIKTLQEMGTRLHFLRPNKKAPADFWKVSFVDFEKLSDEENAMTQVSFLQIPTCLLSIMMSHL
jgi:hypothetical protein